MNEVNTIKASILLVEDDHELGEVLSEALLGSGFQCKLVKSAAAAKQRLRTNHTDLVVSDINMPGETGLTLLKYCEKNHADIPVILMTAFGSIESAVSAMRDGAVDYITKPFELDALLTLVNKYAKVALPIDSKPIVSDEKSIQLLSYAKKLGSSDATILITGPSGTGKEVLARYIHDNSSRTKAPFVAINCAAIPENMLESILFGYEKGSFTGAYQATAGKFEQAQGGTILLDEISEMHISLQSKLLRVLQEKQVERLGAKSTIDLDIRVIATSNRKLEKEIKEGNFREDLYYRLNVLSLKWLPLSDRSKDIVPMAEYFIRKHANDKKKCLPVLTHDAVKKLLDYSWPGNGRELENVIQRALFLSEDSIGDEEILFGSLNSENAE